MSTMKSHTYAKGVFGFHKVPTIRWVFLVNILYTLHVFENNAPKVKVNPMQKLMTCA